MDLSLWNSVEGARGTRLEVEEMGGRDGQERNGGGWTPVHGWMWSEEGGAVEDNSWFQVCDIEDRGVSTEPLGKSLFGSRGGQGRMVM